MRNNTKYIYEKISKLCGINTKLCEIIRNKKVINTVFIRLRDSLRIKQLNFCVQCCIGVVPTLWKRCA